jgi:hypothetical protein
LSGQDGAIGSGNAHILAAMAIASPPTLVETEDGPILTDVLTRGAALNLARLSLQGLRFGATGWVTA